MCRTTFGERALITESVAPKLQDWPTNVTAVVERCHVGQGCEWTAQIGLGELTQEKGDSFDFWKRCEDLVSARDQMEVGPETGWLKILAAPHR